MKYFFVGLVFGVLSGNAWPAAQLSTVMTTRNNRLHVSEELEYVMSQFGVTRDPGAASVFVKAVICPEHHYVSSKYNRPAQLKPLPQEKFNALFRAQALCKCLERRHAYFPARPWEGRFWQCVYYGVVPAMYAVNRYYRANNKIREMIPLMQQAYFWDEFGAMCGMSKDPEARLQACKHVIKMTPVVRVPTSLAYIEAHMYAQNILSDAQ